MQDKQDLITNKIPSKKKRLSLLGQLIDIIPGANLLSASPLDKPLERMSLSFIDKGWCVLHRPGHVGLTGYGAEIIDYIPPEKRVENIRYIDFIDKDGTRKTRRYLPREERIITLTYIEQVDKECQHRSYKWELKTHWTTQRNLFDDFTQAWKIFLEIEKRYDPCRIVWTQLDDYHEDY